MRIISDFHDFYDSAMGLGQDNSITYVRKEKLVEYPYVTHFRDPGPRDYPLFTLREVENYSTMTGILRSVGFCGKVYPCIELSKSDFTPVNYIEAEKDVTHFCYCIEHVDSFVESVLPKKFEQYKTKDRKNYRWWNSNVKGWRKGDRREVYAAFFAKCAAKIDAFQHLFDEHKSPIFVGQVGREERIPGDWNTMYDRYEIIYNAPLKPLNFQRMFDPFRAFQEVNMFMNNVAFPNPPIPSMSNQVRIHQHGFDKYSFRRDPSKR